MTVKFTGGGGANSTGTSSPTYQIDNTNGGPTLGNSGGNLLIDGIVTETIAAIDADGLTLTDKDGVAGVKVNDGGTVTLNGGIVTETIQAIDADGITLADKDGVVGVKVNDGGLVTLVGTTSTSFQLDNDNTGPKLKNLAGVTQIRNAADDDFANVQADEFLDSSGVNIASGVYERKLTSSGTETDPSAETIATITLEENDSVAFACILNLHRTDGVYIGTIEFNGGVKRETAGSAELVATPAKLEYIEDDFADAEFVVSGNNLLLQITGTGEIRYKATVGYQSATGAATTSVDTVPALQHTQGTDVGTTAASFMLDSGNAGARVKNASGVVQSRNTGDTDFANSQAEDFIDSEDESILPENPVMWHAQSVVKVGNALVKALQVSQMYATFAYQNAAADTDSFENYFTCKAGTYTLNFLGVTDTTYGLLDWTIDGVSIATGQDWYSAEAVFNVEKTIASIAIAAGKHTLRGTINGKNGSSSGYLFPLTNITLERTGV